MHNDITCETSSNLDHYIVLFIIRYNLSSMRLIDVSFSETSLCFFAFSSYTSKCLFSNEFYEVASQRLPLP